MKKRLDLVRGWVQKAQSDLAMVEAGLSVEAYDGSCFHAQQSIEKYLKAFLIYVDADFPLTHDLEKLIDLCSNYEPLFQTLLPMVQPLSTYAVELRYDYNFWPSKEEAEQAP